MSFNFEFSRRIYHERTKRGYTQAQVAEAVGTSERWYQQVEKGTVSSNAILFLSLVKLFDIDPNEFSGEAYVNFDVLPKEKKQ